jgi:hypothetical protein
MKDGEGDQGSTCTLIIMVENGLDRNKLPLSSSKRVAAWEIKELRQVLGLDARKTRAAQIILDHRQCTYCRCILSELGDSGG